MSVRSLKHQWIVLALLSSSLLSPGITRADEEEGDLISKEFSLCINAVHGGGDDSSEQQSPGDSETVRSGTLSCLKDEAKRQKDAIAADYESIVASGDEAAKEAAEAGQKKWSERLIPNCKEEIEHVAHDMADAGASDGVDAEINMQECVLNGVVSRRLEVQRIEKGQGGKLPVHPSSPSGDATFPEQEPPQ